MLVLLLSLVIWPPTTMAELAAKGEWTKLPDHQLLYIISRALREWYSKAYEVLPLGDTTYDLDIAKDLEGFAQVVYYKSRRVRCSVLEAICKTASGKPLNSFACVFENKPQIGEKLYPVNPSPVLMEGCQTDSCEKVDPLSECDYNSGLCETVNEEELHMVHAPQAPLHKGLVAYA
ncbi:hypothetical protein Q1695_008297 [Nippostrongylus brasiliensis]|nr:hypothetical protein Q1695_008297 [Nippostrongylus brasiliensis]